MNRISTLAALVLLAACSSTPAPTADRAQNPASPAAAESPLPPFAAPQAAAQPKPTQAGRQEHDHSSAAAAAEEKPEAVTYTCPMHPEVRSHEPGSCPKCGMTLVPVPDKPEHP